VTPNDAYRERAGRRWPCVPSSWLQRCAGVVDGSLAIWNRPTRSSRRANCSTLGLRSSALRDGVVLGGWIERCRQPCGGRAMIERAQRLNPRRPARLIASRRAARSAAVQDQNFAEAGCGRQGAGEEPRFAVALRV